MCRKYGKYAKYGKNKRRAQVWQVRSVRMPTGDWEEVRWREARVAVEQRRNERELADILAELADEETLESAADLKAVQASIAQIDELGEHERDLAERERVSEQRTQQLHRWSEIQQRVQGRLRQQISIREVLHREQPATVRRMHAASSHVAEHAGRVQEGVG